MGSRFAPDAKEKQDMLVGEDFTSKPQDMKAKAWDHPRVHSSVTGSVSKSVKAKVSS